MFRLFQGQPAELPCDVGASGPGPDATALVNWNGDGGLDVSDVISAASFLFLGGLQHPLAGASPLTDCVRIAGCPDVGSCAP